MFDLRCARELPVVPEYVSDRPLRRVIHPKVSDSSFRALVVDPFDENQQLFVVAKFEYRDVFGAQITTGYAYVWSRDRLLPFGGPAYNYDIREPTIASPSTRPGCGYRCPTKA